MTTQTAAQILSQSHQGDQALLQTKENIGNSQLFCL